MKTRTFIGVPATLLAIGALAAGCGGGSSSRSTPASAGSTTPTTTPAASGATTAPPSSTGPSTGSGALTAEAQATAAGDIPDNQVFLTFSSAAAGYSMQYPEGWAQRGTGRQVTIQDKNNLVRVTVVKGGAPTLASVRTDMTRLKTATPSLRFDAPASVTLKGKHAVKVVYSTESTPNPVTGKRVKLVVDRYYVLGPGKVAIVDLGTPQGVDNVDAYRLMIESFRWK